MTSSQYINLVAAIVLSVSPALTLAQTKHSPDNLFRNSSFEIRGMGDHGWRIDKDGNTEADFCVDREEAAAGERSAKVTLRNVTGWGTQLGQSMPGGQKGKTYTFAVLAKSLTGPVTISLQIERSAKPHDRVARSQNFTLVAEWKELHVTFKAEKDFPEGWFAYISCLQSGCAYRADVFRLYEGNYVPYTQITQETAAAEAVRLYDTQTASAAPLADEAVKRKDGWAEVSHGNAAHSFKGDACAANSYLALLLRKRATAPEWYYRLGDDLIKGPTLAAVGPGGDKAKALESFKVVENTAHKVVFETVSSTEGGRRICARYVVRANKPLVETQPGEGGERIVVETQSRHAVLPDLYGGDLVISAADTADAQLRFPSERMILHLADQGNALVMCVWRSARQNVQLRLAGEGDNRTITATEIEYGKEPSHNVWVAVMAHRGIWFEQKISELSAVKDKTLDWTIPFQALWRADIRRQDGFIDSWPMVIKKDGNNYESFGVGLKQKRTVWASARGTYAYPACIEGDRAHLRASKFESLPYIKYKTDGAALLYPLQKASSTPAHTFTAMDVLAEALDGTPEAPLPEELRVKRMTKDKYPATCGVTEEYEKIFDAKQEKAKKQYLLKRLEAMDNFVIVVRERITEYMDWKKKAHDLCVKTRSEKPSLAALADEFDGMLTRFDKRYEYLKLGERNPAAAKVLIEKARALIDANDDKKIEKAKELGRATRSIGGSQDHAIGDFRVVTKEIRQRAGYIMAQAKDDSTFDFARDMRDLTREMLWCAHGHEGALTN